MRHPPTGKRFPRSCEKAEVTGERTLLAEPAQTNDVAPPARSARHARLPYGVAPPSIASPFPSRAGEELDRAEGERDRPREHEHVAPGGVTGTDEDQQPRDQDDRAQRLAVRAHPTGGDAAPGGTVGEAARGSQRERPGP